MLLVTGATGFLGRNLVPHLLQSGHCVRVLVRASSRADWLRESNVDLVVGDVCDPDAVAHAVAGCRKVIHAAAHFRLWGPERVFYRTNLEGTCILLDAALRARVERFVYISTVVVIGRPLPGRIIDENHPACPNNPYESAKFAAEQAVLQAWRDENLPVIILRPGAFYGPWGRYAWNRLFFEDPIRGLLLKVHGGHRFTFPVFIRDVAQAIELALTRGRLGEIYNICGEPITHNQANQVINELAGLPHFRLNVPPWSMIALAALMTAWGWLMGTEPFYPLALESYVFDSWRVSSQKAREELGFVPTPFEQGVRQTLQWYREIGVWKGSRQPWEEGQDDQDC